MHTLTHYALYHRHEPASSALPAHEHYEVRVHDSREILEALEHRGGMHLVQVFEFPKELGEEPRLKDEHSRPVRVIKAVYENLKNVAIKSFFVHDAKIFSNPQSKAKFDELVKDAIKAHLLNERGCTHYQPHHGRSPERILVD
jgi:hypothetical protein